MSRKDVLARGRDDDFFFPSRDAQITFVIDGTQVTGVQPTIANYLTRGTIILLIAQHNMRTASENFSVIGNANVDAAKGLASRATLTNLQCR